MNNLEKSVAESAQPLSIGQDYALQGDEFDIRSFLDLVVAGRWLVLSVTVAFMLIGLLYVLVSPPLYSADGLVQAEEQGGGSQGASSLSDISSLLLGTPVQTQAEIQILQSRLVLQQVVERMNLQVVAKPRYFPMIGAAIARHRTRNVPAGAILGMRQYAWGGEKIVVPTLEMPDELIGYPMRLIAKGDGLFEVWLEKDGQKVLDGKVGESKSVDTPWGPIRIFVQELRAQPGTQFEIVRIALQKAIGQLADQLKVGEQGRQSGVIRVAFTGPAPDFVTGVVNNVVDAYLRQNVERRSADATQSLDFLNRQLPDMKSKLEAAGAALNEYQLKHGSIDVQAETQAVLDQAGELRTKQLDLEEQRQQALARFTARHPSVQALEDQLKVVSGQMQKIDQSIAKLPPSQQEILRLTLEVTADTELYTNMLNGAQTLKIVQAGTVGNVRIVDHALKPLNPSGLGGSVILVLSTLLGLTIGVISVVIQRMMLRGVDDPREIEVRFGLTTYASIPFVQEQRRLMRAIDRQTSKHCILAVTDKESLAIEALRSLRTSLHFAMLEAPNNVIMLTGPSPGLGKSFVTVNLGAVLALSGKRVVVVDADLRRGRVRHYFGMTPEKGISDLIADGLAPEAIVNPTPVENLYFVDRGANPPNPAELLMHERFVQMVEFLSKHYDYVLIDTPPVLAVADASIIGALAGCTLLVLKAAEHPIPQIEQTLRALNAAGVTVRGVLFNQMGVRAGSYGYGNYGYTYYRYDS